MSSEQLLKAQDAGFGPASQVITSASEQAARTLQATADAVTLGVQRAEQVRSQLAAMGAKALEAQISTAAAFAQVRTPKEALELQQRFARETLDLYRSSAGLLANSWADYLAAAVRPLGDTAK
jgi:hypothetical protein